MYAPKARPRGIAEPLGARARAVAQFRRPSLRALLASFDSQLYACATAELPIKVESEKASYLRLEPDEVSLS